MTRPGNAAVENGAAREGIFPQFVDSCGFIDVVRVGVRGVRRKRIGNAIVVESTPAIGGEGRVYARCLRGHHRLSGNSMQLAYGPMRKFRGVSPHTLTTWSDGAPVTCAEVQLVLDGLFRRGYRARVSAVEVTFDVSRVPYWLATRRPLYECEDDKREVRR